MAILAHASRDLTRAGQAFIAARSLDVDAETVLMLAAGINDTQLAIGTVEMLGDIAADRPEFLASISSFIHAHKGDKNPPQRYALAISYLASSQGPWVAAA